MLEGKTPTTVCRKKLMAKAILSPKTGSMVRLFRTLDKDSALAETQREWKQSDFLLRKNTNRIKMMFFTTAAV